MRHFVRKNLFYLVLVNSCRTRILCLLFYCHALLFSLIGNDLLSFLNLIQNGANNDKRIEISSSDT